MLARSLILRMVQMLASVGGLYVGLIGGTFHFRNDPNLAFAYLGVAAALFLAAGLLELILRWVDPEMVSEVGWVLYPSGIALSLVGAFYFSVHLLERLPDGRKEHYPLILGGLLLTVFFVIRIFDLKWLRSAKDMYKRDRNR